MPSRVACAVVMNRPWVVTDHEHLKPANNFSGSVPADGPRARRHRARKAGHAPGGAVRAVHAKFVGRFGAVVVSNRHAAIQNRGRDMQGDTTMPRTQRRGADQARPVNDTDWCSWVVPCGLVERRVLPILDAAGLALRPPTGSPLRPHGLRLRAPIGVFFGLRH